MALHTRIVVGLLTGGALGILGNATLGREHPWLLSVDTWIAAPIGQVFLRLMFMVVMPLVFASVALGVAGIGDLRQVGRLGGKTLGYFLASTTVAGALGLATVALVRPGAALDPSVRDQLVARYAEDAAAKVQVAKSGGFGIETFVNMVTRNPLKSAVDGDMLGWIVFAILFGVGTTLITKDRARTVVEALAAIQDVMVKIVQIAMHIAPFGVAGLIFGVTSRFGFSLLQPLGLYAALVLGTLALHVLVLLLFLRFSTGLSPARFLKRVRAPLITAFSTSSSSATLPSNIETAEMALGVPARIAGFVLPLGATLCMNGTAIFEGITVLFLCQVFGVDLTLPQAAVVLVMTVVTAIGAAGVPGGSIPLLVGILAMFGVPGEGIALVLGIDRILDMSRTTVNVFGDLVAVTFLARTEGAWSPGSLPATGDVPLDDSPDWPRSGDL